MRLDDLNALDAESAVRELLRCCGSTRWASAMTSARPFPDVETLASVADSIWESLNPADWLEAFAAHPKIGGGAAKAKAEAGAAGKNATADWSNAEQAGVANAAAAVRDRLADANREYEARFGYIFIVCATGRSAEEMLALLERRLRNA